MTRATAPFPYRDCTDYALSLIREGILTIDDEGRIWRHAVKVGGKWRPVPTRRAENTGGKGYLRVTLAIPPDGKLACVVAHRLVWIAANGPIPAGLQINHMDCNKQNNRLSNLEVVTPSGNIRHSYAHERPHPWAHVRQQETATWRGRPIISEAQRADMCAMRARGAHLKEIAATFGCSLTHAQRLTKVSVAA